MNETKLHDRAELLGVTATSRNDLVLSRLEQRKEELFAASSHVHGLRLWVTGEKYVLLDEKGFLCWTREKDLVFALCLLESLEGTGATRLLLQREPRDPYAAITALDPRFRLTPKPAKTQPAPRAPRGGGKVPLDPSVLAKLLEGL